MRIKSHPTLGLAGVVLTLAACTTTPRPLPEILPNDRSHIGNRIIGDQQVPGQFQVIARPGDWTDEFMCAAGDYVYNTLGQPPATRVYVVRPAESGTRNVHFTIKPGDDVLAAAEALSGDHLRSVGRVGDNFSAGSGAFACNRIVPFYWDLDAI